MNKKLYHELLVGGWTNPFEKYARQNGNLPQIGMNPGYHEDWTTAAPS